MDLVTGPEVSHSGGFGGARAMTSRVEILTTGQTLRPHSVPNRPAGLRPQSVLPCRSRGPNRICTAHCLAFTARCAGMGNEARIRPLLSDTGGGGGQIAPPGFWLIHPPTHIRKFFLRKKMKFYQRGPHLEVDFRYTTFFLASDPPPPV